MIFFLNIPNQDTLVHTSRNNVLRVGCPAKVKNILRMTHQLSFWWPSYDAVRPADWNCIFAPFPKGDAFIIWARSEKGSIRGVSYNICVLICFIQSVEDANVFLIRVKFLSIIHNLPDLNATLSAFWLLLSEFFLIWSCTCKLFAERVKVDRENSVFWAVPAHIRRANSHFGANFKL